MNAYCTCTVDYSSTSYIIRCTDTNKNSVLHLIWTSLKSSVSVPRKALEYRSTYCSNHLGEVFCLGSPVEWLLSQFGSPQRVCAIGSRSKMAKPEQSKPQNLLHAAIYVKTDCGFQLAPRLRICICLWTKQVILFTKIKETFDHVNLNVTNYFISFHFILCSKLILRLHLFTELRYM